jgi:hypothetical protein
LGWAASARLNKDNASGKTESGMSLSGMDRRTELIPLDKILELRAFEIHLLWPCSGQIHGWTACFPLPPDQVDTI